MYLFPVVVQCISNYTVLLAHLDSFVKLWLNFDLLETLQIVKEKNMNPNLVWKTTKKKPFMLLVGIKVCLRQDRKTLYDLLNSFLNYPGMYLLY